MQTIEANWGIRGHPQSIAYYHCRISLQANNLGLVRNVDVTFFIRGIRESWEEFLLKVKCEFRFHRILWSHSIRNMCLRRGSLA